MAELVKERYGDALFQIGEEKENLKEMQQEAEEIRQVFLQNDELVQLLLHPRIHEEEKQKVLENVFRNQISDEFYGLLQVLVKKKRIQYVDGILEYLIQRIDEYYGIGSAYVTTPVSLSENQKEEVKKKLLETTHYNEVKAFYKVDASLIGGMVIRIGDRVVDSSISTRINRLSKAIKEGNPCI